MKKPLGKIIDFMVLCLIVSAAIITILTLNGNKFLQAIVIITLSLLYVLWGMFHHYREGSLHPKVIMEYIVYALLGSILVTGLL